MLAKDIVLCKYTYMNATTTQTQNTSVKQPSHRASITGGILVIISLLLSAIGSGLVHANFKTDASKYDAATKATTAAADTTVNVTVKLIGVPFLAVGIFLAILAVVFTVIRLGKVKSGGLVLSAVWILLAIWSVRIATTAFSILKAHS